MKVWGKKLGLQPVWWSTLLYAKKIFQYAGVPIIECISDASVSDDTLHIAVPI